EQGEDPRRATLLAFGGAGPVFATLLARELGIGRIVIPPYAGNFSAWGLLGADLTQSSARTQILPLSEDGLAEARVTMSRLFARLEARDGSSRETRLDVRYVGQEHTLTITVEPEAGAADTRSLFTREYERTFGHVMDEAAEIVSLRATVRTSLPRRADGPPTAVQDGRPPRSIETFSFTRAERLPFSLVDRPAPGASQRLPP